MIYEEKQYPANGERLLFSIVQKHPMWDLNPHPQFLLKDALSMCEPYVPNGTI
jgi:hypothetical protein